MVGRPLLEAHLGDELRLDPHVLLVLEQRGRTLAGRRVAHRALELGAHLFELLRREPGADPARVDESPVFVAREVQRAEPAARTLRTRVPHHHEIVGAIGADLEPVGRAAAAVGGVGLLGHDPFEPKLDHVLVQRLPLGLEVIGEAQGAGARQQLREDRFALHEREGTHIEALEREQIEHVQRGGRLHRRALHLRGTRQLGADLQPGKARPSRVVRHDQLAVQDQPLVRQRRDGARDLGEAGGEIVSVAGDELRLTVLPRCAQPVPVELQLEQPSRLGERLLAGLGQHQLRIFDPHGALGGAKLRQLLPYGRRPVLRGAQLLDRHARKHRFVGKGTVRGDESIALLDQEPFLHTLLDLHERPPAAQLVALQVEEELALVQALQGILDGDPHPAVPHDHGARAVIAFRNDPLEVAVLEWVILHVHRKALVGGVRGRALGNRPRLQHPFHFEPQVPMEAGGGVHVNDEQAARCGGRNRRPGAWLGRALQRALCAVGA